MNLNSMWTNGEKAEALTDKYFFAPWSSLHESEVDELASLTSQLRVC